MSYCRTTLERLRTGPEASPEAAVRAPGPERGEDWLLRNVEKKQRGKLGEDAADPRLVITELRVGYGWVRGKKMVRRRICSGIVIGVSVGLTTAIILSLGSWLIEWYDDH